MKQKDMEAMTPSTDPTSKGDSYVDITRSFGTYIPAIVINRSCRRQSESIGPQTTGQSPDSLHSVVTAQKADTN